MVLKSLIETCSWTSLLEDLGQFLQRDESCDLLDQVGIGFFHELHHRAHLLDADELSRLLAEEVGEVEDDTSIGFQNLMPAFSRIS